MSEYVIDESQKVHINSSDYYLRIRSCNADNPVVLFLHGGCGAANRPFIIKWQSPLARFCTIAAWDQRGAGMAFSIKQAAKETLTKELYLDDIHNVISYLKKRFNKEKIILAGHSFGTQLAVWYIQKYPQDIECYAGMGQVVDTIKCEELSYYFTLTEAKKRKNKAAEFLLRAAGPPVNGKYRHNLLFIQRNYLNKFGGAKYGKHHNALFNMLPMLPCMFREYPLKTMLTYSIANSYCYSSPLGKEKVNFMKEAKELKVPVYLFMGNSDYNTVHTLAKEWFDALKAPYKKYIVFEKSAHQPQWEEPEKFNSEFIKEVLGRSYNKA